MEYKKWNHAGINFFFTSTTILFCPIPIAIMGTFFPFGIATYPNPEDHNKIKSLLKIPF